MSAPLPPFPVSTLPLELLARILSSLKSPSDLRQAAATCRLWYDVTASTLAPSRLAVAIVGDDELAEALRIIVVASRSEGKSSVARVLGRENLRLTDLTLSYDSLRWNAHLAQLRSLHLARVDVSPKDLSLVLLQCRGLRELALIALRDAFLPGNFLEDASVVETLATAVLARVWRLDLSNNQYLTDALFYRILAATPAVTHLSLRNCKIQNHSGIYKKFYPSSTQGAPSPSVFTFRHVLAVLGRGSGVLEDLDLYNTGLDGPAVQDLAALKGLSLTGVDVGKCSNVTQQSVLDLARKQPRLAKLRMDYCRRVLVDAPATSMQIFEELGDTLSDLSLRGLSIPRDFETLLAHSDGLRELRCCDLDVAGESVARAVSEARMSRTLRSLSLNNFVANPRHFVAMFSCGTSRLTWLELRNCQTGVTDPVLQAISQNLSLLRHLNVSFCRRLTDAGFMGASSGGSKQQQEDGSPAANDNKISLGCQGERQILKEVEERSKVEKLVCPAPENASGSIDNLKNLHTLLASSVVLLTSAPLLRSFCFPDLRVLDLSSCAKITDDGFRLLGEKNPCLEVLRAKQCSIGDEGLAAIIACTKRLVELDLESCKALTTTGVLKLSKHCPMLRKLNLSYCLRVRLFAVKQLLHDLPFLRSDSVAVLGLHIAEAMHDEEN